MKIMLGGVEQVIEEIATSGLGSFSILPNETGFVYTYPAAGEDVGYESGYVTFGVDFTDDTLASYEKINFTFRGLAGDIGWKPIRIFVNNEDLFEGKLVTVGNEEFFIGEVQTQYNGETAKDFTVNIPVDFAKTITGDTLYFAIFCSAGNASGGAATSYIISDIEFVKGEICDECDEYPCICFYPVDEIPAFPLKGIPGVEITLPADAKLKNGSNKAITWELTSAGATGATLDGNVLKTIANAGSITVKAVVEDGEDIGEDYEESFTIVIRAVEAAATLKPVFAAGDDLVGRNGAVAVVEGGRGYQFTYGGDQYDGAFARFKYTFTEDARLADYKQVKITIEGKGGDVGGKRIFMVAAEDPYNFVGNAPANAIIVTDNPWGNMEHGIQTHTLNINSLNAIKLDDADSLWITFYIHAASSANSATTSFIVKNVEFIPIDDDGTVIGGDYEDPADCDCGCFAKGCDCCDCVEDDCDADCDPDCACDCGDDGCDCDDDCDILDCDCGCDATPAPTMYILSNFNAALDFAALGVADAVNLSAPIVSNLGNSSVQGNINWEIENADFTAVIGATQLVIALGDIASSSVGYFQMAMQQRSAGEDGYDGWAQGDILAGGPFPEVLAGTTWDAANKTLTVDLPAGGLAFLANNNGGDRIGVKIVL